MGRKSRPAGSCRVATRTMVHADLDSVIRIENLSFPHPWTREDFLAELGREPYSRCHVAETAQEGDFQDHGSFTKGEVVGFVMAWLVMDELHITNLAVAPEARGGGVAAELLHSIMIEAADLGAVWCQLEVRRSNRPARALYEKLGFQGLGIRKGYYRDGEDAVVMGKDLVSGSGV